METPTRPFTIGGQTLSQTRRPAVNPVASSSSSSSAQKKNVSFKSSMFPSPPSNRLTFAQGAQQQQQQQQQQPYHNYSNQTHQGSMQASTSSSAHGQASNQSEGSSLSRSTSAPNLLPAPGTSRTSPQDRHLSTFGQSSSSSSSNVQVTSSLPQSQAQQGQANKQQQQSPRKPISSTALTTVPVDPKLALEARRTTMSKRLRVNLVLLLAWYLVTDSRAYAYVAGHVVTAYPGLRAPIIWIIGRVLPLLFLYNATEAFFAVRSPKLPSSSDSTRIAVPLPAQAQSVQQQQQQQPSQTMSSFRPSLPISTGTYKSSPKTRPSTNMLPSPSMPERRIHTHTTSQHGTPASLPPKSAHSPGQMFRPENGTNESPTSALRRALLSGNGRTAELSGGSPSRGGLPSSSSSVPSSLSALSASPSREKASPRVQAYWARNEVAASPLHRSIRTEEDIDRLVEAAF